MDIYLMGTPVRQLLSEIGCGGTGLAGVKVEVPPDRYDNLITRIVAFRGERRENVDAVNRFLAFRCGREFLRRYQEHEPEFIGRLQVGSYFDSVSDVDVLNTLYAEGLLPEDYFSPFELALEEFAKALANDAAAVARISRGIGQPLRQRCLDG
jgi:hypothetical protein